MGVSCIRWRNGSMLYRTFCFLEIPSDMQALSVSFFVIATIAPEMKGSGCHITRAQSSLRTWYSIVCYTCILIIGLIQVLRNQKCVRETITGEKGNFVLNNNYSLHSFNTLLCGCISKTISTHFVRSYYVSISSNLTFIFYVCRCSLLRDFFHPGWFLKSKYYKVVLLRRYFQHNISSAH